MTIPKTITPVRSVVKEVDAGRVAQSITDQLFGGPTVPATATKPRKRNTGKKKSTPAKAPLHSFLGRHDWTIEPDETIEIPMPPGIRAGVCSTVEHDESAHYLPALAITEPNETVALMPAPRKLFEWHECEGAMKGFLERQMLNSGPHENYGRRLGTAVDKVDDFFRTNEHGVLAKHETVKIPLPKTHLRRCELHVAEQGGRWHWAYSYHFRRGELGGSSFAPAPKWDRSADTRELAIDDAVQELLDCWEERETDAKNKTGLRAAIKALMAWRVKEAKAAQQRVLAQDNTPDLDRDIDYTHFDKSQLSHIGGERIRIEWPVEKLVEHPLNREVTAEAVKEKAELLKREGQRDAIESRVPENWWHTRKDKFCVPDGHLQILRGATRTRSARKLKWDTVDVVILADISDEEAERILARSDDQTAWPMLAKGRLAAAMHDRGLTYQQIGDEFNVDKSTISRWIKLAGLPECWQRAVTDGIKVDGFESPQKLPESYVVRGLEKYTHPELLQAIYDYLAELVQIDNWAWSDLTQSKEDFAGFIESLIDEVTRPIAAKDKPYCASVNKYHGRLFDLTEALEDNLDIIDVEVIPRGKKAKPQTFRRALNCELYDKLQQPFEKQLQAGEIDTAGRPIKSTGKASGTPGKGKGGTGSASAEADAQRKARVKREQAEARERRREADAKLKDHIARWRIRLLRQQIAKQLKPHDGDYLVPMLVPLLVHATSSGYQRDRWVEKITDYLGTGKQRQLDPIRFLRAIPAEPEDPLRGLELYHCRLVQLLLWPVDAGAKQHAGSVLYAAPPTIRDDVPNFADRLIEEIAQMATVDVDAAWRAAADPESAEHVLVREFFELHTSDQLVDLAGKMLPKSRGDKISGKLQLQMKKTDRVAGLLKLHESSPLKRPAAVKTL